MTAKRLITGILAVLVIAAVMAPSLMAQSLVSGDLTGTVTDPSGAVVSGATVTLKSDATGATRTTTTGSNGTYRFSLLSPGSYTISVNASGFSKTESKATVSVGQASIADVKMAVGSSTTTVEVTTTAPLVSNDNTDLSTNFSQNMIANSPNGGNDITYIAQTAPGATMNTSGGYGNFSSFGLPATSNLFTVNGENDMDPYLNLNNSGATNLLLGKNDVQEATVINNAYSGQYGQQAGTQVSYVTKSGTNQFHGNAIYYWTGRALDANDWFNNLNGVGRPFANNNQWAASIGGPIKKDKLFFFVNTEGLNFILPAQSSVFSWSPNFINGALANIAATNPAELPLYQQYFNIMQAGPGYPGAALNFQPTSAGGDGGCGAPIVGNCIGQYQANGTQPGHEWILSGRVDYNLSDKDHLFWRVKMDHGTQPTSVDFINPAFTAASYQPSYDGQGQWTHVFSPNATNNFVYAGSYYRAIFTQQNPDLFPFAVIGSGFDLTQVGGVVYAFPQGRNVTQYQFVDDFSLTKGAHALKFGANYRRYDISDYTFSRITNPEVLLFGSANGQADFFDGIATQTRKRYPEQLSQPVALWGIGLYAQDEWRVNKALKLTFALRAEHNSNPVCQTNCAALMNSSFQQLNGAGLLSGDTPYNQIIDYNRHQIFRNTDGIDWSPRFGFAWSPGGSDRTVVRGGFGMFYDALPAVVGDNFMLNMPGAILVYSNGVPWADTTTPNSPYIQGAASAAAIRAGLGAGASYNDLKALLGSSFRTPSFFNQVGTFKTPYFEQWNVQLQQALGDKASISLGYNGNHGVHIPLDNPGLNAYGAGYPPFPDTPATLDFTAVDQYSSSAVSNYNGLTATFQQRLTYGFTVQANYTWSHAMDIVSNGGISPYNADTAGSLLYQINPACMYCNNYGNADYDVRSYFSASYVWQTPWKFSNKWTNGAFGGWILSQNFFARTGLPYTVMDGNLGIGNWSQQGGTNIADTLNYVNYGCSNGLSQCNNAANFWDSTVAPPPNFPNQRRNMYRGPGYFDSDFTINKNFKLTERVAFGVGANFYNVFNHPNFDLPDNFLGDSTFGQILLTVPPPTGPYGAFFANLPSGRIIQFQGKIVF